MKQMFNPTFAAVAGLGSMCASIAAPILWVGGIKEVNAVQDVKIATVVERQIEFNENLKEVNAKLNALLIANGINPDRITNK